jgi:hypothetical protein
MVSGLRDREKDRVEAIAEEHDMSQAEVGRNCIRAAVKFWDATGEFKPVDVERAFADESGTNESSGQNKAPDKFKNTLRRNLSTTNPLPLQDEDGDDLVDIVIKQLVVDALTELQEEDDIYYQPGEGYLKNE